MVKRILSYLIFLLILIVTTVNVSALYFEASDDNYAKKAETITLKAYGYEHDLDVDSTHVNVGVMLINFRSNKWIIACTELSTQQPIFACAATITDAYIEKDITTDSPSLLFTGEGKNTVTGQMVSFMLHVIDEGLYLSFFSENENEPLQSPCRSFFIHQNHLDNYVLFKDRIDISGDFSTPGWKLGTTRQIKNCLMQYPHLKKF